MSQHDSSERPAENTQAPSPPPCWGLSPNDQWILSALLLISLILTSYRAYTTLGPAPHLVRVEQLPMQSMDFRIDINTTDWPPLDLLPGMSERMARRITDYRKERGPFGTPDELRQVPGVGPKLIARISPYLTGWTKVSSE